ncbi:muscle M-line assembly protein unc-89 isoform X2 [Orussus abietinus]|uniref:muscle M-line assembly protein unc-89 isoform X2 n=1 Tax=Orussus abietinus TaxID=222816 RepID=UPI00062628E5|nr:muscle M-line assembly protein unc-89 isoform X2 [Orussus abietinus]
MRKMASGLPSAHQRKLGPAPIASFEDLSDEVENGEAVARMPGIVEVTSPVTPGSSLKTPSTPRIDISRASSSSHHEDSNNSRESSPERELLAGAEPPQGTNLVLGYKEDAQDLRSSTEELDLHDPVHDQDLRRDSKRARRRKEDGSQSECGGIKQDERERKDSNCSEIILLNISGRTSRLSSVGSQGSGASGKLSVVSATSSRSPSPHKCLLETSFCGSKPTLADNFIEPSKPETDDLEKILLQREADTTKALIPENIKVPMVGGNLKPDPLDKPRRRGREERKEIFRREVEITKKVLERVNIEVPVMKKQSQPQEQPPEPTSKVPLEVHKPASLDLNDKRKKPQNFKEIVQTPPTSGAAGGSPKLPRHQKVRDLEGSRTPSPCSVSRKSSFASLFKGRSDSVVLSPVSPTPATKPRRSLTSKIRDTTESLRSRSKSRERSSIDRGSSLKKESKNKGVFSSTLSLFKKRERKKSYDEAVGTPMDGDHPSLESIGNVEFTFNAERERKRDDSIFISLHADDRNYEEALPSESTSIPLETPTKLLDEYDAEHRIVGTSIVTEASIEYRDPSLGTIKDQVRTEVRIEERPASRTSREEVQVSPSVSLGDRVSRSSSRDSKLGAAKVSDEGIKRASGEMGSPESKITNGTTRKPEVVKPARKSKEASTPSKEPEEKPASRRVEMNGGEVGVVEVPGKSTEAKSKQETSEDGLKIPEETLVKTPSVISDLDHNSSESERDSEIEFIRNKAMNIPKELPDERKGLCYEESFEEDFPYVPTTLPMEKSVAVPILPIKERLQEVRTIPIERPRSTTPINPTLLDEFVMHTSLDERRVEKMKISLPHRESFKLKSPHRQASNTFTEFAGKVQESSSRRVAGKSPSPPPLPPRAAPRPTNWINFEEIPEKRKAPKRIQTIPRTEEDGKASGVGTGSAGYSYVQPEECRCECHEESRRASLRQSSNCTSNGERPCNGENCSVPASTGDRASIVRSLFLYFQ